MTHPSSNDDNLEQEAFKNRLVGAILWLGLLVLIVPQWYANPVAFDPQAPWPVKAEADTGKTRHPVAHTLPEGRSDKAAGADSNRSAQSAEEGGQAQASSAQWILRLVAYRSQERARKLAGELEYDYQVFIKHFPESDYYSVRSGPYQSREQAEKDQKKLDQMLDIESQLVEIQPEKKVSNGSE
ncbi:SPOR domain-containing protein [Hydrogenovibrio halophilus]|uniref:SPOR domain-containing protein n=1 Tax=Hydrogenovibrio halophilus TaxID=373391 RepID=UPI0003A6600F|nr:SPOR domain-containing protein [Hydrogenovibrio halophilus]